ncbi:hypothetical protein DICPUDRAFT_91586 [Dictyostelium purpureum]|uniref:Transmembrane protein n=1 Tax=Dictyostelium purpureum TaxID=5786 RepID=F0ZEI3_DICPU|nr:uncharacterized protein DICPUDRAFT_91586 [Dictyostelium purpureum]EGC37631.1 hypothetical protein DICPUDRAFT_91586 [Dictyostelium purpureum]|eukprot:XP_003285819.1 hypothetical protein DICPUDRAFT_91586 [Dictyostelium purpureum]
MRFLLSVVVLVLSVLAVANASFRMCSAQKDCPADQYCTTNNGDGYCVNCLNDIDCGLNEYCSTNIFDFSKYGSCQKFDKNGDDCINLPTNLIQDIRVNNDSKCAVTYFNYDEGGYPNQLSIDKMGSCIDGKCRICNYAGGASIISQGKGKPRQCVFPGVYESVHSKNWNSGSYYEDPLRVWLAIFFCLIVIQIVVGVFGMMRK